MALINGTPGNDILPGTTEDDVINGFGGTDVITGDAGNDVINGGTGVDNMSGGEGNDTFIADRNVSSDVFDGGPGTDTIEFKVGTPPIISSVGPLTPYTFSLPPAAIPTLTSIERLRFASEPGQGIFAQFTLNQIATSGITELVGGAGRDFLTIMVSAAAGIYTMPHFTLTDWSAPPVNAWGGDGDAISLTSISNFDVTLFASETLQAAQVLTSGSGNDFLYGSANADRLNGGGGNNQLFGLGHRLIKRIQILAAASLMRAM